MTEQTNLEPVALDPTDQVTDDAATSSPATAQQGPQDAPEMPVGSESKLIAKLRQEAAEARIRAKRADALQAQLVQAWAAIDGRLIDPTDLAHSADMHDDDGNLDQARVIALIDQLLTDKPHLGRRRPAATLEQGARPEPQLASLAELLRARA